jgi:hypothetical protein
MYLLFPFSIDLFILSKYSNNFSLLSNYFDSDKKLSTDDKQRNKIVDYLNCDCIRLIDMEDLNFLKENKCCFCSSELVQIKKIDDFIVFFLVLVFISFFYFKRFFLVTARMMIYTNLLLRI